MPGSARLQGTELYRRCRPALLGAGMADASEEDDTVKNLIVATLAVVVVSALSGMLYAPPHGGGHGGHGGPGGGGFGPGGPDVPTDKREMAYVEGVIKTVNANDDGGVDSVVIAGKKNKDGSEGLTLTLHIRHSTQVFIGEDAAKPSDLVVGKNVIAGYAKPPEGVDPSAILIRILKPADAKKDAPKGGAKDSPKSSEKAPADDSGATTVK